MTAAAAGARIHAGDHAKGAMPMRFNVKCSQRLDDRDTALVEEYPGVSEADADVIIKQYQARSIERSYVESFTISIEIIR